ncbi:hypothetical protein EAH79_16430 [Sphingomonas koreensis]|nr:hypothetical protein EAH79_16430 [Sphingomonas koreensis]
MKTIDKRSIARALGVTGCAVGLALLSLMSASDRIAAKSDSPGKSFIGGDLDARAAFERLARDDPQGGLGEARRSVQTAPVDPASTSALGASALSLNRPDQAFKAFAVAGTLGWRDIPTQLYWLAQASAIGDTNVLAERLDALLRLDIKDDVVANSLHLLGQTQIGQTALATLFIRNPPWQHQFLVETGNLQGADLDGRIAAIALAAAHSAPLDCEAIGIAASKLILRNQPAQAKQLWRQACDRAGDDFLSNGTFSVSSLAASQSPFAWQLQSQGGLDVRVQAAPRPLHEDALEIQSSMTVRTIAASQIIALEPGRYHLSWMTALDNGKPDPSITVLVRCGDSEELTTLGVGTEINRRNRIETTFSVPLKKCPIQIIAIQKAASGLGETQIGWIDDVNIAPLK